MNLKEAENLFANEKLNILITTDEGKKFLKLRSLNRSEYLKLLLKENEVDIKGLKIKELLSKAFDLCITIDNINDFIKKNYKKERENRKKNEENLYNELCKLKSFDWGGLYQNSLERTIVNNYIKKISSYNDILDKIKNNLQNSLQCYVLCSWYNHWTSILIEDLIKDHDRVIPSLGLIPKIDFFIDEIPFDLKVTYLPEGYIVAQRKIQKLPSELSLLKKSAKKNNIPIDTNLNDAAQLENLWLKHDELYGDSKDNITNSLKCFRLDIVKSIEKNPEDLIKWLYENQGDRRFDASNRFFIVLINTINMFESWKMKRSLPLLKESITNFFNTGKELGKDIEFNWKQQKYKVKSDILIIKND